MTDPRSDWYDIGDVVTLTAVFRRRATNELIDPTAVTCAVLDPDGDATPLSPVRDSLGSYHATVSPTIPGVWEVRWVGTGVGAAAEPDHFLVREVNVP